MDKFVVDLIAEIVKNPDIREFVLELSERVADRVADRLLPDLPGNPLDAVRKWLRF